MEFKEFLTKIDQTVSDALVVYVICDNLRHRQPPHSDYLARQPPAVPHARPIESRMQSARHPTPNTKDSSILASRWSTRGRARSGHHHCDGPIHRDTVEFWFSAQCPTSPLGGSRPDQDVSNPAAVSYWSR